MVLRLTCRRLQLLASRYDRCGFGDPPSGLSRRVVTDWSTRAALALVGGANVLLFFGGALTGSNSVESLPLFGYSKKSPHLKLEAVCPLKHGYR